MIHTGWCFLKKRSREIPLLACAVALVAFFLISPVERACAGAAPTSPCDPQYMDALEARAWLEAQREIAQNQNLIFKPDSVLEYTCFAGFLNEAASNWGGGNRQFSETNKWGGRPSGFSATSTDTALTNVVLQPMRAYLNSNFNTSGGFNAGAYLNNRRNIQYSAPSSVSGGTAYTCTQMQDVWQEARCMNFNENAERAYDGFFDFAYYASNDPRRENSTWALQCNTADPRIGAARQTAFNATGADLALYDVGTEYTAAEGDGGAYNEDDVVTHLDEILPGACSGSLAVPTGVLVQRPDINSNNPYMECVCTKPGCSAQPGGPTTCGSCVP